MLQIVCIISAWCSRAKTGPRFCCSTSSNLYDTVCYESNLHNMLRIWMCLRLWTVSFIRNYAPHLGLLRWPYYHHTVGHESWRQSNSTWLFSHVIRLLQALMLLLIISSLPNLLTARYSALYCPFTQSGINANVIENRIKYFMRAHELMLRNISIGYAIARENRVMASTKKRRFQSYFYRLGLLYLFLNFPNIKQIAYIYNRSITYLAGMN